MQLMRNLAADFLSHEEYLHVEPINQRIKVYQLPERRKMNEFIHSIVEMAHHNKCDKLIFFVKENERNLIEEKSFVYEGMINGFFNGKDAFIYAFFLDDGIEDLDEENVETDIMRMVDGIPGETQAVKLPEGYEIRWAEPKDRFNMAKLYETVFESYPTPMNDPDFILEMMNGTVNFSIAEKDGEIISACAADVMPIFNVAELTDCVTLPGYRNKGLLFDQALKITDLMKKKKIITLFSYSRSISEGMNVINAKLGFTYGGKMMRNSKISRRLENMNIWYKRL